MNSISSELLKLFKVLETPQSQLISFEGIEGCGKTTQINLLQHVIQSLGYNCSVVREPGGTHFGEKLRDAILNNDNNKSDIAPLAEAHLFASSRAQLLEEVVLPLLNQPKNVVIYDRYIHSSLAYQGFGGELGVKTILELHQHYPLNTIPHQTFYLNISIETSIERQAIRNNQADYFESKSMDYYKKIVDGYNSLSDMFKENIHIIDSERSIEEIHKDISEKTLMTLGKIK